MISPWKKIRYRIEWLAVLFISRVIPLLPRRSVLLLARLLGPIGYFFDSHGRTTTLQNLNSVYGPNKSPAEIKRIARGCYCSFARTFCDQFWTTRLNRDNFQDFCRYEFADHDAFEAARQSGAIWVTPHYGNFEWISLCIGYLDLPFCIVTQEFKNPLLTDLFKRNREHSGHTVIPQQRSMIRLYKHLQNHGHAAFLTDLTVPPGKAATVINCMGLKTCVTTLHGALAHKSRLPVIPGISIPQPDGTYLMRVLPPLQISANSTVREIAQQCWDAFEPTIREHPEHWIWMYKHWRYRPPGNHARYPAYANPSKKFARLLENTGAGGDS